MLNEFIQHSTFQSLVMRNFLFIGLTILSCFANAQAYKKLHNKATLVDTHNDVMTSLTLEGRNIANRLSEGHSDLYRFKEGGVDVQFFSIWTSEKARNKEGFYKDALQEIDSLQAIAQRSADRMILATNYEQVKKGIKQHKLVALIGVEGGHMIENDIQKLDDLFIRGMRYLTLTWNNSTAWASSSKDETSPAALKNTGGLNNTIFKGLTDFGRQIVRRMNELGVIVDLSHAGEKTFYDAIATSSKPVLLSHSSVYSICPHFRNVKDVQIKAVAKNRGVICINFFPGFISREFNERFTYLTETNGQTIRDSIKRIYMDSLLIQNKWEEYCQSIIRRTQRSIPF